MTENSTGNETRLEPGWKGLSVLNDLVCPIVAANGMMMNKSMYRNYQSERLDVCW